MGANVVLKFAVPGSYFLKKVATFLKIRVQERSHRNSKRSDRNFLHFCARLHRQSSSSVSPFQLLSLKPVSFTLEPAVGFSSIPRAKSLSRQRAHYQGSIMSQLCCLPIVSSAKAKTAHYRDAKMS